MKRARLLNELKKIAKQTGHTLVTTEGTRHTRVTIGNVSDIVGRHRDIPEETAKGTIRKFRKGLGL